MNRKDAYQSSIPEQAREKITQKHGNGSKKQAEYYVGKENVGLRTFYPCGALEGEYSFRNGVKHGWEYRWDSPNELLSATSYENGLEHGTAYQWDGDGPSIGSYKMEHGTGIDLWWNVWSDGSIDLSEVYHYVKGARHGFEWHFFGQDKLSEEKHWREGMLQGIEREWNFEGGLRRGFPRYWLNNERVTRAKYLRAAAQDAALPPFRPEENKPVREFPPLVARHLLQNAGTETAETKA